MSTGQPSAMDLHPLLLRQLRRLGIDPQAGEVAGAPWQELLRRVSRAYEEHDQDRYLLERSQELASQETAALYAALRQERDALEDRVRERTAALRLSEARLGSLLSLSTDWIWEQDADLRFTYVSDGFGDRVGVVPRLIGQRHVFGRTLQAEPEAQAYYEACVSGHRPYRDFTYSVLRPDGVRRWLRVSGQPVFDVAGVFRGYRGVGRDVTEIVEAQRRADELARSDGLTGLPNRRQFMDELERSIGRAGRAGSPFALCFVDLDRFKGVNDTLGHHAGDEMLAAMARRLRAALRVSDLVARIGGDEFVVLVEDPAGDDDLEQLARKLLATLGEPMMLAGQEVQVTGSIGIARFPQDGDDAATLLRHADTAMYQAKDAGKNRVEFYTPALADRAERLFALEAALRLAIARRELLLHFQPKVDIACGRIIGAEALLRWQHPSRGMVPPGEFIDLAEERGLIVPIGRWVIEAACQQMADWRAHGIPTVPIAINVSARQFGSNTLVDDIASALARHDLAPQMLEVEITESALMADPDRTRQALQRLHAMGLHISIDDFGTGYSSLSYLKRFPADQVKIDRAFIRGLPDDRDDIAITQAVIAMAHSLGLRVVAEGVETEAQLGLLRELQCDQAQGYLLGRPMPAEALAQRLQEPQPPLRRVA